MNTPTSTASGPSALRNVLASDVKITGAIRFSQELSFDGTLDGEILSEGALTLGKSSKVTGEIYTNTVVLYGAVNGNITVDDRCELKTGSSLHGDLKASRILVEEDATFIGKSEVSTRKPDPAKGGKPR